VIQVTDYEVLFGGDDAQQSIWKVAKPQKNKDHPTIKPMALVKRAIENSSRPKEIVSDWFAGSGTTLIACEACGRYARVMELDPVYCDVIVRRWEAFTGKTAKKWTKSG
jgi:DNA modification methylase